jgi:hypothetical protein
MKKLFLPYELAIKAKEKGFDEKCFAWYNCGNTIEYFGDDLQLDMYAGEKDRPLAPLYQQIVDWFIEKHNIHPNYGSNHSGWYWNITKTNGTTIKDQSDYNYFSTHYEALNKAIEESFKLI